MIQSKYVWKWRKESHRGAKLKKERRKKEKQNHISRDMKSYVPLNFKSLSCNFINWNGKSGD